MLPNTLHRNSNIEGANQQLEQLTNSVLGGKPVDIPNDLASSWMASGAEQSKILELQRHIASHVQEQANTDMPQNCFNAKFPTRGKETRHGSCNTSLLERLMAMLPESYLTGMKPVQQAPCKVPKECLNVPGVGQCSASGIESLSNIIQNHDFSNLRVDSLHEVLASIHPSGDAKIAALRRYVEDPIIDVEQDNEMISNLTRKLRTTMNFMPHSNGQGNVYGNNGHRQKPLRPGVEYQTGAFGPQVVPPPPPAAALGSAFAIASESEYAHSTMRSPSNDEYKIPVAKSLPIPTRLISPTYVPKRRTQPIASDIHTLIIKKIPARIAPSNLLELWPAYQSYNLLYLPYNHRTRRTVGFVIVNFVSNEAAVAFRQRWQGQFLLHESSVKNLDICVAEVQGFVENLIAMKANKKIARIKNVRYLPVIVLPDGTPTDFKKLMDTIELPPEFHKKESDGNSSDGDSAEEHATEYDDEDVPVAFSC
jgi:hypothetical protein